VLADLKNNNKYINNITIYKMLEGGGIITREPNNIQTSVSHGFQLSITVVNWEKENSPCYE